MACDSQRDGLAGRKIVLPGKMARFSPKLREQDGMKGAKPDQHTTRRAHMEVGTIDVREGTLKFDSPGFLCSGLAFCGWVRGRRTGQQSQVTQFPSDRTFQSRRTDGEKPIG